MMQHFVSIVALLLFLHSAHAAKVYMCKWPRSVLSSGDPNLTVTIDGTEVRCDRTLDAHHLCEAACDYQRSDPWQCVGPVEDGDICNTVWGRSSLSYYKLESIDSTQACMRRYNSDCSADMGDSFCYQLNVCYGSYQQVVLEKETFVARYGYEPSFLQQPWEILEPPSCSGYAEEQCCMMHTNYYRCLHGVPPMVYHRGLAQAAQAWADMPDKPSVHSPWGSDWYPSYTEVLTWGTWGCERGVGSWYKEIGVHNFSIYAVQDAGGSYNSGHMVLLLWSNHTMVGCGMGSSDNAIIVCNYAWRHQGSKDTAAWQANLHPRSGATQEECRASSIASLNFPVLAVGEDISEEQVLALRAGTLTGDGSGWIDGGDTPTAATYTSTTPVTTNTSTTSVTTNTSTTSVTTNTSTTSVTTNTSTTSVTTNTPTTSVTTNTSTTSDTSTIPVATDTSSIHSTTSSGTVAVTSTSATTTSTWSATSSETATVVDATTSSTGSTQTVTESAPPVTTATTGTVTTAAITGTITTGAAVTATVTTGTSTGTEAGSTQTATNTETGATTGTTTTTTTGTTMETSTGTITVTRTGASPGSITEGDFGNIVNGGIVNDADAAATATSSTTVASPWAGAEQLDHTSGLTASWILKVVLLLTAVVAW